MRIVSVGHAVFAAVLIGVGVLTLVDARIAGIWQPLPASGLARDLTAWLCAFVSLAAGLGLIWRRTAAPAARLLLAVLILWLIVVRAPRLILQPLSQDSWSGAGETTVITAAAWVLYAGFAADWDRRRLAFATGERGLRIARILYGLALIPFGVAHLVYIHPTAALVPAWLPAHLALAYFTGFAFIAAGLAALFDRYARLAVTLSALQMGLFTLLVWAPIMAAGARDAFQLSETVLSLALTAAGWVVAESYRDRKWFSGR